MPSRDSGSRSILSRRPSVRLPNTCSAWDPTLPLRPSHSEPFVSSALPPFRGPLREARAVERPLAHCGPGDPRCGAEGEGRDDPLPVRRRAGLPDAGAHHRGGEEGPRRGPHEVHAIPPNPGAPRGDRGEVLGGERDPLEEGERPRGADEAPALPDVHGPPRGGPCTSG